MPLIPSFPLRVLALLLVLPLAAGQATAQSSAHPRALKPELHSGPPEPSAISNHEVTAVTLPGLHLSGTTLTVKGACKLISYTVASDTEIDMKLQGDLTIDDKEASCDLTIHQGALQAGTYVIVNLTDAEQEQKSGKEGDAARVKGEAYMASLGNSWTLRYADGTSEFFTAQPADPGALPDFTSSSGSTAKIILSGDNLMMIAGECVRSGTLTGAQVKDGKVLSGDCPHPGPWTAQKDAQKK
jgi:hypothetical protein